MDQGPHHCRKEGMKQGFLKSGRVYRPLEGSQVGSGCRCWEDHSMARLWDDWPTAAVGMQTHHVLWHTRELPVLALPGTLLVPTLGFCCCKCSGISGTQRRSQEG